MASKLVTDREKSANSVTAAAKTHAARIGEALAAVTKTDSETLSDFVLELGSLLSAARDTMVAADEANEAELADDSPTREAREAAAGALRAELVSLREILTGVYGAAFVRAILVGGTPEDPVVLARFASEVSRNLSRATLPESRIPGARFDVGEARERLEALITELGEALGVVRTEEREAQTTLVAKTHAMAAFDRVFTGVANTLSGLLQLAGEGELAARIRPSRRRPGQTVEDAADPSEPAEV